MARSWSAGGIRSSWARAGSMLGFIRRRSRCRWVTGAEGYRGLSAWGLTVIYGTGELRSVSIVNLPNVIYKQSSFMGILLLCLEFMFAPFQAAAIQNSLRPETQQVLTQAGLLAQDCARA